MKQTIMQYLMVALLVVGAFFVGKYKTEAEYLKKSPGSIVQQQAAQEEEREIVLSDDQWKTVQDNPVYAKGSVDAPVVMVDFTDFQCPFCKRYVDSTYDQIVKKYVDTGKVRYMFRDLPLDFHPNAVPAAVAARCGGVQNKFEEMHKEIFANQEAWSGIADPTEMFVGYAKKVGLNQDNFKICLRSEEVKSAVKADSALAATIGATGTPTFIINGQVLTGAQPLANFEALIESQL